MLDDIELGEYKNAWLFTSHAVRLHTGGALRIETDWYDLPAAVLTGLNEFTWNSLVQVRHLDPYQISPFPAELFQTISDTYDCIVFCWDRGNAARAYGGGPIAFTINNRQNAPLACIRSLSTSPLVNLHEFLHNLPGKNGPLPVHGLAYPPVWPGDFAGDDEADWYAYILSHLIDRAFLNKKPAGL